MGLELLLFLTALASPAEDISRPQPIAPQSWITPSDYPKAALKEGAAGAVQFELQVTRAGTVSGCKLLSSTGSKTLDDATCGLLESRAHFLAATRKSDGKTVPSVYAGTLRWQLPTAPSLANALDWPGRPRRGPGRFAEPNPALSRMLQAPPVVTTGVGPPADPTIVSGMLKNGLRYAIKYNAVPFGSVSMRFKLAGGSIVEADDERGYAHILEHMTFRGSTNVPDGQFAKSLESLGLAFGADATANTFLDSTIYALDFPAQTQPQPVGTTGLSLLREVANRATLGAAALAAEKGVVLAEKQARDTAETRLGEARLQFLFAGQRVAARWPIGTEASIRGVTPERLRTFYRTHYRPEEATLVVVGAIDPATIESQIKAQFGDWGANVASPRRNEAASPPPHPKSIRVFTDAGAPDQIEVYWVAPYDPSPDTFARQRHYLAETIAMQILNERFSRQGRSAAARFASATISRGNYVHSAKLTAITAIPVRGDRRGAITAAILEQRRLAAFGVTQAEYDRALARARSFVLQAYSASGARRSNDLATALLASMDTGEIVTSPDRGKADFELAAAALKVADIDLAARAMFDGQGPLLFVSSGAAVPGGEPALLAALQASERAPIERGLEQAAASWAYGNFGPLGTITERKEIRDLGLTIVRFANGTSATIKSVSQPRDQILVDLNFGAGLAGLPRGLERSYWMATSSRAYVEGGLGKASASEIEDQLSGKTLAVQFSANESRFHLSGTTRGADLETQLQLLTAYFVDPGFRPEAVRQAQALMASYQAQANASADLTLQRDLGAALHDGDPRWVIAPKASDLKAGRPEDLPALMQAARDGPVNVVLVGDLDVEKAIEGLKATIGALPVRGPRPAWRDVHFPKTPASTIEAVAGGGERLSHVVIAWPTHGFFRSTADSRAIQILAQVVRQRLMDGLRAKDGLTYSPNVFLDQSELFADYGMIGVDVEVAPEKEAFLTGNVAEIMRDLARTPVSTEELGRAVAPMLSSARATLLVTNYWLGALVGADEDPRLFDTIRTRVPDLAGVRPADIQRLARDHLSDKPSLRFVVRQCPTAATATPGCPKTAH